MRAVVVHHQVNLEPCRKIRIDVVEEAQELLMAMAPVTVADGDSARYIQGRKQRRHTMPLVIVRLSCRYAWSERQHRLGAVQRLDLALFINAQHDRMIWRIHIQSHDVPHLLHKLRVFGEFEVLYPMRLQPECTPDPHNGGLRQSCLLGPQSTAPVRAVFPAWTPVCG